MTTVLTFENSCQHVSSSGPVSFSRSSWSSRHSRPYAPVSWLIPMWDLWHDSFPCEMWLVWCDLRAPLGFRATRVCMPLCYDSFPCETSNMTHSHVRHDSLGVVFALLLVFAPLASVCPCVCETWLIHTLAMPYSHVRHDVFIYVTCLIPMWDMTHLVSSSCIS